MIHITLNVTINAGDGSAVIVGEGNSASVTCRPLQQELAELLRRALAEFLCNGATQSAEM